MCIMTRTFHPVGQGAFYTEKFDFGTGCKVNIVYDCGTHPSYGLKDEDMQKVIENAFDRDERIDGVFISHFDADHVNGFPGLFQYVEQKVGHIFLPHLTDEDVLLCLVEKDFSSINLNDELEYANAYRKLLKGQGQEDLFKCLGIDNGRENGPRIHLVGGEDARGEVDGQERGYDKVKSGVDVASHIWSSNFPSYKSTPFWQYIPFNFDTRNGSKRNAFRKVLANYLKGKGRSIDEVFSSQDLLGELKKCYDEDVPGTANGNSMTLLSCAKIPWFNPYAVSCFGKSVLGQRRRIVRSGCLYTGDYCAKGKRRWHAFWNAYAAFMGDVGCVQLPHHGSDGNYNEMLGELDAVFVACYGRRNIFQHPGPQTMYHLGSKHRTTILVTEENASKYLQKVCIPSL